jgi:hypothetical protein
VLHPDESPRWGSTLGRITKSNLFGSKTAGALFATTIVMSSYLIFLVQPIIAKQILPWFGGAASVWNTCLFFFQFVLLLGYVYAHLLVGLSIKQQASIHIGLLAISCLTLPIIASATWRSSAVDPALRIMLLLSLTVGLPYFVLASTSPLLQAWYSRFGSAPYWLFALSNAASLAGLLSYPFLIEPALTLGEQGRIWSAGFLAFGLASSIVAICSIRSKKPGEEPKLRLADNSGTSPKATAVLWVALSGLASLALVSFTSFIAQNVASVPLLWVLPLSIYLITLVLAFASERFQGWRIAGPALVLSLAIVVIYRNEDWTSAFYWSLPAFFAGLFLVCLYCHGELARTKPHPTHLTRFYILISAGGALGSLAGSILAPLLLQGDFEMLIALSAVAAIFALQRWRDQPISRFAALGLAVAILGVSSFQITRELQTARILVRNFYSSLRIVDLGAGLDRWRRMEHGQIEHGAQYLDPARRTEPISYYSRSSGVALAIRRQREVAQGRPLAVGIIGLGAGVIAAYGEPGDHFRFYEINPQVATLAHQEFSYLSDSKAKISLLIGDARLSLEAEPAQNFDLLIIDAFSGDAIPIHLLTREAMQIYRTHVKPFGALLFHISNKFVDLEPALSRLALEESLEARVVSDEPDTADEVHTPLADSDWVILVRDATWFDSREFLERADRLERPHEGRAWTDDFNNLMSAVRLQQGEEE